MIISTREIILLDIFCCFVFIFIFFCCDKKTQLYSIESEFSTRLERSLALVQIPFAFRKKSAVKIR